MVTDYDMSGERGAVGKDTVITHEAVMRNMGRSHKKIAIANDRPAQTSDAARADGDILADNILIANYQRGWLARIFFVLRFYTN